MEDRKTRLHPKPKSHRREQLSRQRSVFTPFSVASEDSACTLNILAFIFMEKQTTDARNKVDEVRTQVASVSSRRLNGQSRCYRGERMGRGRAGGRNAGRTRQLRSCRGTAPISCTPASPRRAAWTSPLPRGLSRLLVPPSPVPAPPHPTTSQTFTPHKPRVASHSGSIWQTQNKNSASSRGAAREPGAVAAKEGVGLWSTAARSTVMVN